MGKYVESNLNRGEVIVEEAKKSIVVLLPDWILAVLFCWTLIVPIIVLIETFQFFNVELAFTNKRVIGKATSAKGDDTTKTMDAPLNKIQSASVSQKLWGKVFKYGTVRVDTAAGRYNFGFIKDPHGFKNRLMAQIEEYENDKIKEQAAQMASAMAAANAAAKQD